MCPEGAVCPHGTELKSLIIGKGYFRFGLRSSKIYPCSSDHAIGKTICIGSGDVANQSLCSVGHEAALCQSCSDSYYRESLAGRCVACDEGHVMSKYTGAMIIAAVLLVNGALVFACRDGRPLHVLYTKQKAALVASREYLVTTYVTLTIIADLERSHVAQGGRGYREWRGVNTNELRRHPLSLSPQTDGVLRVFLTFYLLYHAQRGYSGRSSTFSRSSPLWILFRLSASTVSRTV